MPLNASIFGNMLNAPKSPEEYALERESLKGNMLANALNQRKMDEYDRGTQEQNALRSVMRRPGFDPMSQDGQNELLRVSPSAGASLLKTLLEPRELQAKIGSHNAQEVSARSKATKDTVDSDLKVWDGYRDQVNMVRTPQEAAAWITRGYNDPVIGPFLQRLGPLEEGLARIPQDPAAFEGWRQNVGMSVEKFANLTRQKAADAEAARHHQATEDTATGQLRVAQGSLGLRQQELELQRNMPKGQVVQSDQGIMLVDPRSGASVAARGPDGLPLTKQMKDIPAPVNTALLANSQNLNKVQQAIDLLDGKNVGALKGDKEATGWKGYVPQSALNRLDAKGVDTRAMIADIGSLIIHDRSGAAVTAAESPRLMPFIPLATDDKVTARKKLVRFKQLYEQEQEAMQSVYSKDQGYRAPPLPSQQNNNVPGDISAILKKHGVN